MRVAFVMPGVGVVGRGAEAFVVEIAGALAERHGFDVELLCRGPAPLPSVRLRAVARDSAWLQRLYGATRLGRKLLDTLFLDPVNVEWDTAALSAFPTLWRGGYDVVVMEGGLVGAWLCRLLRAVRGVPFVDVAHGLDPKWEGAFARRRPDRVVTFTRTAAAMLSRLAPRAAVEVIPHGVDLELFSPGGEAADTALPAPVVMTAGAVDGHKQMHLTLDAVARMAALGRPASLLVLGDGPLAADLDRRAGALLPAERYHRRVVPRSAMPACYLAADVFTLPSKTESFGLAYLEAMACNRPCVAPDDPLRREVVGDGGLFCDPADPALYAAALAAALDRDWGDAPRRRAAALPFSATADAWAAMLRAVAASRRPLEAAS